LDSSFLRLKTSPQPAGRTEALAEIEEALESARADASHRESETGWLPLLGARDLAAARTRTASLSALLEEVRSARIRAQRLAAP
jgi:hypothetical protein